MKQLRSKLYMETRVRFDNHEFRVDRDPNGYLFSKGRYPTKIMADDLPEWYLYGYMYKHYGYISAQGVKHLVYVPDYTATNHLHKYDTLFISYGKTIVPADNNEFPYNTGYDYVLNGHLIVDFLAAAATYSDYDISSIAAEVEKKKQWYKENNNDVQTQN